MRSLALCCGLVLLLPSLASAQVFINVPGVRVNLAPPPVRVEVRPVAPSARHTWIAGHWTWRGNQHVWSPGAWMLPPNQGWVWEPARWVNENGAWVFFEGHWKHPNPPMRELVAVPSPGGGVAVEAVAMDPVLVAQAPPAPIAERQPVQPFPSATWIPGYWHWQGNRYSWVAGYWEAPRGREWTWEAHHWQPEGNHWRFVAGHWRHL